MKLIFGPRGRGKDLLCTKFGLEKMLNNLDELYYSKENVSYFNSLGYNFTTNYEHLLFSNIEINCSGTYIPMRKSYVLNPYKLGLYVLFVFL